MNENPRDIYAADKLSVAITPNLLDAVRAATHVRRLSIADYVRGAVQARLSLDGVAFVPMPEKPAPVVHAVLGRQGEMPVHVNIATGERQWR